MVIYTQNDYQNKQIIAKKIMNFARVKRSDKFGHFSEVYEGLQRFIIHVSQLRCFASKVATTVSGTMNPQGQQVAYVSSKQAWILACAAVENGIDLSFNKKTFYRLWLRTN